MKNIPKIITISELARLVNLSRPTLYKYIELYDVEETDNIPSEYNELFAFIENKVRIKDDIYDYCLKNFNENTKKSLMDRIQVLVKDNDFNALIEFLIKNNQKLDYKKILEELERYYG